MGYILLNIYNIMLELVLNLLKLTPLDFGQALIV